MTSGYQRSKAPARRRVFNVPAVRKCVLDPRAEYVDLRPILLAACAEIERLRKELAGV